jgi:peptidoglycan/LPS O-acetylase OafA/YrhL
MLGHIGVLAFFVHTALVLMLSMKRTSGHRLITNFYIRRIFRIYPLSIACVLAVLIFRVPADTNLKFVSWSWSAIAENLFLVQNVGHTDADVISVIKPLWSLPFEVQMYLVLPFIYLLLKRFSSNITVLLLWVAFFMAAPYVPVLEYAPCFMGGVFAYQLSRERTFAMPSYVWPISLASLLALYLVCTMRLLLRLEFSDYVICMFLGVVIPNVLELKQSLVTTVSHIVAKYSYGIYLCHLPVFWLCFSKLSWLPLALQWTAMATLMVAVPFAAFKWIEDPCITIGRRVAERDLQFLKVKDPPIAQEIA